MLERPIALNDNFVDIALFEDYFIAVGCRVPTLIKNESQLDLKHIKIALSDIKSLLNKDKILTSDLYKLSDEDMSKILALKQTH